MKQILVLQNQRIGDTLQTTPLLVGLREKHSPCHITLVTNKLFADLNLSQLVDELIHFDQNGFFQALGDPARSLVEKYDLANEFLETFRARRFDLVVDVPADTNMHLLASALENAGELRAAVLSPARNWRYSHPEVMLLYTIGLCREVNRFNLVDLQNLFAGVRPAEKRLSLPYHPEAEKFACRFLEEAGVDPKRDLLVALQPGASEERKRWGDSHFAQLARLLVERLKARVLVCGSPAEKASAEKICADAGVPVISAVGQTGIAELAALVRKCHTLVTNDTGTMHVATAVGTPVVDLSTGPVFFRETGPYAEGSIVVEGDIECSPCNFNAVCTHYSCRELITPEMVIELVETLAKKRDWSTLERRNFHGAKLHRALFNDVGRLEFLPVFKYPLSFYQFLGFFYAHAWEVFYGLRSRPKSSAELLDEIERLHDLASSWGRIRDEVACGMEEFRHVEEEANAARKALRPLVQAKNTEASQKHWVAVCDQVQEIYERIVFYCRARPGVRHFSAYLELAVSSQAGAEPISAIRKIHEAFDFVSRQVEFLRSQLEEASTMLEEKHPASPSLVTLSH